MVSIRQISAADTWELRHRVMWPDKDLSFVKLPDDNEGLHFGLFLDGHLISVASLFVTGTRAQLRKFATWQAFQGQGYGSQLLKYILQESDNLKLTEVWCHARVDAQQLYRRFGFAGTGHRFTKENVAYEEMKRVCYGGTILSESARLV